MHLRVAGPYPGGGGGAASEDIWTPPPPQIFPMYISNVLIWTRNPDGNPLKLSSNPLRFKEIFLNSTWSSLKFKGCVGW